MGGEWLNRWEAERDARLDEREEALMTRDWRRDPPRDEDEYMDMKVEEENARFDLLGPPEDSEGIDVGECPAGGPHRFVEDLTEAQLQTGLRPRHRLWVCEECGEQPDDATEDFLMERERDERMMP